MKLFVVKQKNGHTVYEREYKFSTVHKFCDDLDIYSAAYWFQIESTAYRISRDQAGHADIEIDVDDYQRITVRKDLSTTPPLVIASYDIECVSADGGFPVAEHPEDYIVGIGTSVKRIGQSEIEHAYFAVKETCLSPSSRMKEKLTIYWFPTELDMILGWRDWLMKLNPDVITGYNINLFDFKYIYDRLHVIYPKEKTTRAFFLSKLWAQHTPLVSSDFSSSAYGERKFYTFQLVGRLVVDLYEVIRREKKYRSYKLDYVAKEILTCPSCDKTTMKQCKVCHGTGKMAKLDLSPHQINVKFQGTPEDRGMIAEYCSMDL